MEPSFKIINLCMLCLVLLVSAIVFARVWSMPDLPSSLSKNKMCVPAGKGHLVCDDTPQRLLGYLQNIITDSYGYDQVSKKQEEQQQRFLKESKAHFMAIYDSYVLEMKPSAKVAGKEQSVNTKNKIKKEMTPIRVWRHGKELFDTSDTSDFLRHLRLLLMTTFVPTPGLDLNWIFDSKTILTPGNIDLKDGALIFAICIHNRVFLDEDTPTYIYSGVYIKTLSNATNESCEPSYDNEMLRFVGLSASVLYIGIMLFKTRREVRTIGNGKFGLCDSCHQARDIVRLISCRPYKHFLCHSCLARLRYCPECNTSIRAFM